VDQVRLEGAALNFRQGGDFFPDREFSIILFESDPAALNGRTIVVPNDTVRAVTPHVLMQWKEAGQELPKMEPSDKYVMRLEFEKLTGNKLQGRIYLCVFDREESFVRGKFEANLP